MELRSISFEASGYHELKRKMYFYMTKYFMKQFKSLSKKFRATQEFSQGAVHIKRPNLKRREGMF